MQLPTDVKHIVTDPAFLSGRPHIAGHRITVHHIVGWYQLGQTAEQIAAELVLSPAEVHAALVYYYNHLTEINDQMAQDRAAFDAAAQADASPLAQRLRALIAERKQEQR